MLLNDFSLVDCRHVCAKLDFRVVLALLPFDFLPDLIPFIGWIDDVAVVVISILTFLLYASSAKLSGNGKEAGEQTKRDSRKGKIVNGEYRLIDDDENP